MNQARPQQSQQSRLVMCQHTHLQSNFLRGSVGAETLKKKKKGVPLVAALMFELDAMTLGMRRTEALSNLQWLPLLYESELATLAFEGCLIFFLSTLPAICLEIPR